MPTINLPAPKKREPAINKYKYQKIYQDPRWKRIRRLKFQMDPLCEICKSQGVTNVTEEIHHIIPFQSESDQAEIERLAFDLSNTQSLCVKHHKTLDNLIRKGRRKG
jgi:5-methylcytosine-specific restriction endonuclease McrA